MVLACAVPVMVGRRLEVSAPSGGFTTVGTGGTVKPPVGVVMLPMAVGSLEAVGPAP